MSVHTHSGAGIIIIIVIITTVIIIWTIFSPARIGPPVTVKVRRAHIWVQTETEWSPACYSGGALKCCPLGNRYVQLVASTHAESPGWTHVLHWALHIHVDPCAATHMPRATYTECKAGGSEAIPRARDE